MNMKYPFAVQPWRFGKGKGKGGGKGAGKGKGKGDFRGNHWVDYEAGAMYQLAVVDEPQAPAVEQPFAFHVTDDYGDYNDEDGWNDDN